VKLSVVIPAQDEAESIGATVEGVAEALEREGIDYEVLVVDDHSHDATRAVLEEAGKRNPRIRSVNSGFERGYGFTVRAGLAEYSGDAVAVMMADGSDDPEDLVRYHRVLEQGWDCAFGSRFAPGSSVHDYPRLKLIINRLANWFIQMLFRHHYNDTTNAFKAYRREVIESVQPLISPHFNLTVEIPLKAIVRGHTYAITPIRWSNRRTGESKLALQEMGSRYAFIVLYVFFEHHLSRGDYRRPGAAPLAGRRKRWRAGVPAARAFADAGGRARFERSERTGSDGQQA
jgi:dolichol-phosphate mannosyltransferase